MRRQAHKATVRSRFAAAPPILLLYAPCSAQIYKERQKDYDRFLTNLFVERRDAKFAKRCNHLRGALGSGITPGGVGAVAVLHCGKTADGCSNRRRDLSVVGIAGQRLKYYGRRVGIGVGSGKREAAVIELTGRN